MTDSPEQYLQQCKPQFGRSNPERMRFAHWEWMVRSGKKPYWVRSDLGVSAYVRENKSAQGAESHPDWCFDRFGMTRTRMPDGRIICIGGEHEDSYDPDFCIYNDVTVLTPEPGCNDVTEETGSVEIYGYPRDVFEPTDFHTATQVDDKIYIIGCLGYQDRRITTCTPIYELDTNSYKIEPVQATGTAPGWIYKHHASYDAERNAIAVRGGSVWSVEENSEIKHFGAYRLSLEEMRWEVISEAEQHRKFLLEGINDFSNDFDEPSQSAFVVTSIESHPLEPEDRGIMVYWLDVQGVRFQFRVWVDEIHAIVEGDLPPRTIDEVLGEVLTNLRAESGFEWTVKEVDGFE